MLLVYNTAMIQASRAGSYSFQMISMLFGGIVVPMVYGALFLGETLTGVQIGAILMMLVSFVLMNLKGLTLKGSSKGFLFWCLALFLSNGFYGTLLNVQQLKLGGGERNEMIILTYLGMAALYALIQLARDRRSLVSGFRMGKKPLIFLLVCCACAASAAHMILYVLTLVDATVLYSRLLFHEKLSAAQLIGIAIAVASIIMLSL